MSHCKGVHRRRQRAYDEPAAGRALERRGVGDPVDPGGPRSWEYDADAEGLSCTTGTQCLLVPAPLRLDRSGWVVAPHPADVIGLTGVSCVSPTACIGLGSISNPAMMLCNDRTDATRAAAYLLAERFPPPGATQRAQPPVRGRYGQA